MIKFNKLNLIKLSFPVIKYVYFCSRLILDSICKVNCSKSSNSGNIIQCGKMSDCFGQNFKYEIHVEGENKKYGVKITKVYKVKASESIGNSMNLNSSPAGTKK